MPQPKSSAFNIKPRAEPPLRERDLSATESSLVKNAGVEIAREHDHALDLVGVGLLVADEGRQRLVLRMRCNITPGCNPAPPTAAVPARPGEQHRPRGGTASARRGGSEQGACERNASVRGCTLPIGSLASATRGGRLRSRRHVPEHRGRCRLDLRRAEDLGADAVVPAHGRGAPLPQRRSTAPTQPCGQHRSRRGPVHGSCPVARAVEIV